MTGPSPTRPPADFAARAAMANDILALSDNGEEPDAPSPPPAAPAATTTHVTDAPPDAPPAPQPVPDLYLLAAPPPAVHPMPMAPDFFMSYSKSKRKRLRLHIWRFSR